MNTKTSTSTSTCKVYTRKLSKTRINLLKRRAERLGVTYGEIARECRPRVSYGMVLAVMNGAKVSSNVMAALARLELKKAAETVRLVEKATNPGRL